MDRILLTSILVGASASALLADNPVVSHRHLADPNGFVFNDRIYAVCSNDDDNGSGYDMKSAVVISTSDLKNWTDHGDVFRVTRDATWAGGSYAPTAIAAKGKVYLYFPNVTSGVGVLVADRPEGPYKDPLGKALINSTLCDGVAWCFDPDVFVDADGSAYLVYGGGDNTANPYGNNIRGIALGSDMISVKGSPVRMKSQNSFEGPFVHKYNGNYYYSYPTSNGANIDYAMSSTGPISGYVYKGTILPNPTLNGANINQNNNSHASMFAYKGSWYMMYHDRRLPDGGTYKRDVSIDKLEYNADGTIKTVVVTSGMAQIANFNPYDSIPAATMSKQSGIKASYSPTSRINALVPQSSGAWIRISGVDFGSGAQQLQVNAATAASGVAVEVRTGSETGPLAGTCAIAKTANTTTYATSTCSLSGLTGVKDLFLKFVGTTANANFAWYRFVPQPTGVERAPAQVSREVTTEYVVHDLHGRVVRAFRGAPGLAASEAWTAHAPGLPAGTYLVRISSPEGVRVEKFARAAP